VLAAFIIRLLSAASTYETSVNFYQPTCCTHRSKHLWNVGKLLSDYTAQQPRKQPSSCSLPWETQISWRQYSSKKPYCSPKLAENPFPLTALMSAAVRFLETSRTSRIQKGVGTWKCSLRHRIQNGCVAQQPSGLMGTVDAFSAYTSAWPWNWQVTSFQTSEKPVMRGALSPRVRCGLMVHC
jgi:hypothetical protein